MIQSLLVHGLFIHKKGELRVMQRMIIYRWEKKEVPSFLHVEQQYRFPLTRTNGEISPNDSKWRLTKAVIHRLQRRIVLPCLFFPSSSATSVKTWTLRYSPQPKIFFLTVETPAMKIRLMRHSIFNNPHNFFIYFLQ